MNLKRRGDLEEHAVPELVVAGGAGGACQERPLPRGQTATDAAALSNRYPTGFVNCWRFP